MSHSQIRRKYFKHLTKKVIWNKGGGALLRLRETNFEALVLLLKIGLGGYFFLFERWWGVLWDKKTHKGLTTSK